MDRQGISLSRDIVYPLLQGCNERKDLPAGRRVYALMVSSGLDVSAFLGDHLIRLFASCGSLVEANQVFFKMSTRSVFTWNSIILAHVKLGKADIALELYKKMQKEGIQPDKFIFSCVLKACGGMGALEQGRLIHHQIVSSGLKSDIILGNSLLEMYAKCGNLDEAHEVFDQLPSLDMVSWAVMIAGYAEYGHGLNALELFDKMQQKGTKADKVVFLCILKACGSIAAIRCGILIHVQIIRGGFDSDIAIGSTVVDMYAKWGKLNEACNVFKRLLNRTVVSWGAMISGYAEHGHGLLALELFAKMQEEGIMPDKVVFLSILKACGSIRALEHGKLIHEQVLQSGLELDMIVGSTIIDMYAKCGSLEKAHELFDKLQDKDVVSWGAMIAGYAQHGNAASALELFQKMEDEGIKPSKATFLSGLKACGSAGAIAMGRLMHHQIVTTGIEVDVALGSSLIDMYAKCGTLDEGHYVLDSLPLLNAVTGGAMIAGYAEHGHGLLALKLFEKMELDGVRPDRVMFLSVVKACSSIGALMQGRWIHDKIIQWELELDLLVGNSLVGMYVKCGSLEEACNVFDKLPSRDMGSWGAIIMGYAQLADCNLAGNCVKEMKQSGLKPNDTIYTCLLAACSHAGLVKEGCQFFKSMRDDHCILPNVEHYSCMVDLLGRAGCFFEAEDLVETMPVAPSIIVWTALLTSCRIYGNAQLAKQCFNHFVLLDPDDASGYMLMLNTYADVDLLEDVNSIQQLRNTVGAVRKPGKSCIEVDENVHEFIVGTKSHPRCDEIYMKLDRQSRSTKEGGYVPLVNLVMVAMPSGVKRGSPVLMRSL